MFWDRLLSLQDGLLLFAIFVLCEGCIYPALHTEPEGRKDVYVWPVLACLLVLILLGTWVRLMFLVP